MFFENDSKMYQNTVLRWAESFFSYTLIWYDIPTKALSNLIIACITYLKYKNQNESSNNNNNKNKHKVSVKIEIIIFSKYIFHGIPKDLS